ncbi:ras GTPase-activating-like protein IQGAP3 [Meleagris gallopavo]|uniref:ras GTPase-activating-like protein IQGAP3 n=1 Tax=Meleagris gallopavo TaxID=9103 RepID=UPI000549D001|nr:ras GTPase-activating-like protein IQGAP3 [Meleagris gallopavo]
MRRRALWDSQTPTRLKHRRSLVATSQLSMEEKKQRIVRNLRRLEGLGLVDAGQHYQGLINELAKDIRNQRRYRQHRREELLKLRQTLRALDAKTLFYEEQIDYYNQYIRSCLDSLAASNKLSGKSKKLQPLRYSAARLSEMGVLLEIQDLPASQYVPCTAALRPWGCPRFRPELWASLLGAGGGTRWPLGAPSNSDGSVILLP